MRSPPEQVSPIRTLVVDRLTEQLAPAGWRQHRLVPDDEVAFVRAPSTAVVFHLSVNLAGDGGISLTPALGVEHAIGRPARCSRNADEVRHRTRALVGEVTQRFIRTFRERFGE